MSRGGRAWIGVAALLGAVALAGWWIAPGRIDWQPARAALEPWRALSAVGVHYGSAHLAGNLVGVLIAGVFGVVAQVPMRLAAAWLAAWPLTHLALLAMPTLAHYGGLSGVLHAGVAIVITHLLASGTRAQRRVGAVVLLGFGAKLLSEAPWGPPLRHPPGWEIAFAPIAHTTGALAGALCALLALALRPAGRARAHG